MFFKICVFGRQRDKRFSSAGSLSTWAVAGPGNRKPAALSVSHMGAGVTKSSGRPSSAASPGARRWSSQYWNQHSCGLTHYTPTLAARELTLLEMPCLILHKNPMKKTLSWPPLNGGSVLVQGTLNTRYWCPDLLSAGRGQAAPPGFSASLQNPELLSLSQIIPRE